MSVLWSIETALNAATDIRNMNRYNCSNDILFLGIGLDLAGSLQSASAWSE